MCIGLHQSLSHGPLPSLPAKIQLQPLLPHFSSLLFCAFQAPSLRMRPVHTVSLTGSQCSLLLRGYVQVQSTGATLKAPWSESASELYRPSDRRLSAKWLPTFADKGCHVVSVTDPYGRILGFLDRSRYFFFQVAPQLYSRGWVDPVPDPLLFFFW
jgi:hypothetical protein